MMYLLLKLVHILAAITAVGTNLTYVAWLVRSTQSQEPAQIRFALRGIKFLDDYVANPSYVLALLTGLAMVWVGNYDLLHTPWMFIALGLFAVISVVGLGLYTPGLTRQIHLLDTEGPNSVTYQRIDRRQTILGAILFVLALTIIVLMVFKPTFW